MSLAAFSALRRSGSRVILSVVCWTAVLATSFPLFWMISTSLKPDNELFLRTPTLLPSKPTVGHYVSLLSDTPFPSYFRNSLVVATTTTLIVILVATFGAYSLTRFRYPGRRLFAQFTLFTYLLPSVALVLPLYLTLARLHLANSLLGLVITHVTFALPFALWLLRSYMVTIPADLDAAARIDGATRFGALVDVIMPQALPGIISTSLFIFIASWNEYLYALVLISRDASKTLPTGMITMLTSSFDVEWSQLMAGSVMMSVPLLIAFTFLQRQMTLGFGVGVVKG
jgi:ABC-type glycerol-3-phosphate transport system permease component